MDISMAERTQTHRHESYKWILLLTATAVTMIDFGLVFSFGTMFVTMMETFQTGRAATATVQSILIGVTLGFGAVSGVIVSKVGLPVATFVASLMVPLGFCLSFFANEVVIIYFTIGLVSGIGISLAYISCVVAIDCEFSESQRTLCLSILNTSYVVASIAYPYCLEWLTEQYGLKGTFLILGGFTLNTLVLFVMCFINREKSKNNKTFARQDAENDYNVPLKEREPFKFLRYRISNAFLDFKKYLSTPYLFILVATGILLSSLDGYLALMLDIALWKQIDSSRALISFVIYSSFTAGSCLVPGLLKQKKGINSCAYPIFSSLTGAIGMMIIYFANDHITFMTGTSLVGVGCGGILSSSMNAAVKIVEIEFVPVATGLLLTVNGLLSVGTGPLFGWLRDTTSSYRSVLIIIMTLHGVSAVLYMLALIFRRLDKTKAKQNNIQHTESQERNMNDALLF
ncbi:monocarboxylate transporter 2-like [Mercenaria mercenaria]|uniref:monocarboxylate transporter 2-like n=1 Tax=Mercenaria mercenaria TaxID=6596 RepID=UPI00234EF6CC|nr:monocarboxylate transporter 2-like [Mercenaria mercenaria]